MSDDNYITNALKCKLKNAQFMEAAKNLSSLREEMIRDSQFFIADQNGDAVGRVYQYNHEYDLQYETLAGDTVRFVGNLR